MKILSMASVPCVEVKTDEDTWNNYRKFSGVHWEIKTGGIWYKMIFFKEMEDAYREKLKTDWKEKDGTES